jgi:rhomboid protease GluP
MHAYAMDVPEPLSDRLAAALVLSDPTVYVVERGPRHVLVSSGPMKFLVIEPVSPDEVAAIAAAHKLTGVILVNTAGLTLEGVKYVSWRPGTAPQRHGMIAWRTFDAALKKLDQVQSAHEILTQRREQGDDVARFMAPLMARKPLATWAIAALSTALFGLQMLWGNGQPVVAAGRMGADVPSLLAHGEWWRVLAPMLLHGSVAHLALNMLALFSFGTFLERFLGTRRYLLLYVLAGAAGALGSLLRKTDIISVGASGGIWGLMVAGAVLVTLPRGTLPELVTMAQRKRAWTPIIINAAYSFQPGIDLVAHFAGGIVGGLLVLSGLMTLGIPQAAESNDPMRAPLKESFGLTLAALLGAVAMLASISVAVATGRPWELTQKPKAFTVEIPGEHLTIALPRLMAPTVEMGQHTVTFGKLQYDPNAFVVYVDTGTIKSEELADLEASLIASIPNLPPTPLEQFHVETKTELRKRDGRPFLYFRETAADGRECIGYWLVVGHQLVQVLVFTDKNAPMSWHEVAINAPFTIRQQP